MRYARDSGGAQNDSSTMITGSSSDAQVLNVDNSRTERTLAKPILSAFSRKHWRQRSRPYLRIRPAWCAQRRLGKYMLSICRPNDGVVATYHWREPLPNLRGRENQTESWVILVNARGADKREQVISDTISHL
jgi:hypothetical protein